GVRAGAVGLSRTGGGASTEHSALRQRPATYRQAARRPPVRAISRIFSPPMFSGWRRAPANCDAVRPAFTNEQASAITISLRVRYRFRMSPYRSRSHLSGGTLFLTTYF